MKNDKTKNLIIRAVLITILAMCIVLFVVGLVKAAPILTAIAGVIITLCLIAFSINILTQKERLDGFDWTSLLIYYLTAVIFIGSFLISINEEGMRNVLTAIFSATISGLLALVGVGLTIKYSRIYREEEEIKKCKPRVYPISEATWDKLDKKTSREVSFDRWKTNIAKPKTDKNVYFIKTFYLANFDYSTCIYDGIIIDSNPLFFDFGIVLQKDQNYALQHNLKIKLLHKPKAVALLLTDVLDNMYQAEMEFEIIEIDHVFEIRIISMLEIKRYPAQKNKQREPNNISK